MNLGRILISLVLPLLEVLDGICHDEDVMARCIRPLNCSKFYQDFYRTIQGGPREKTLEGFPRSVDSKKYFIEPMMHACFHAYPYDTTQLPLLKREPLILTYQFGFNSLIELTASGKFSFVCTLSFYWADLNRCWNKSEYNLEGLNVNAKDIWTPSVRLVNTRGSSYVFEPTNDSRVFIFDSGDVELYAQAAFDASCSIVLTEFPFDTQNCSLYFVFQYLTSIDIMVKNADIVYQGFRFDADEWKLVSVYDFPKNFSINKFSRQPDGSLIQIPVEAHDVAFPGFQVDVIMRRNSGYYICNLIVPVILMSILSVFSGLLHSDSGERLNMTITVLLGFMFIQSVIATLTPTSVNIPKIALYVLCCIILAAMNVIASAVLLWLSSLSIPLPPMLDFVVIQGLAKLLLIRKASFEANANSTKQKMSTSNAAAAYAGLRRIGSQTKATFTTYYKEDEKYAENNDIFHLNDGALQKSSSTSKAGYNPWLVVVDVLNRFAILLYLVASFSLVLIFLGPLAF